MKKKTSSRKRKYVVLLSNHTDHRDDDSVVVMAKSRDEAMTMASFDKTRFSIRSVLTAQEARKRYV